MKYLFLELQIYCTDSAVSVLHKLGPHSGFKEGGTTENNVGSNRCLGTSFVVVTIP